MLARSLRVTAFSIAPLLIMNTASAQGELCSTAVPVTPGTYVADGPATGFGASNSCFGSGASNSDWYTYTPAGAGTWTVGSCMGGADTRLSVYTGDCSTLICYGSADDTCPTSQGGSNFASEVAGLAAVPGETYYIEWDDRWTSQAFDWYLEFFCAGAPQSTYTVVADCANNEFSIEVTINTLGTATSVDITNNGGAPTISGVGAGTYTVGPFPLNSMVSYSVVNLQDPGCDSYSPSITNFPCPIVSCGPDQYTYCYGDNEETYFVYQSATTDPIALFINAGSMFNWDSDSLFVFDGGDDQAPVLYAGNSSFSGLTLVSTNPDNIIMMKVQSGPFTSCLNGGGQIPLDYTVACMTRTCGLTETYCYTNNDSSGWVYQAGVPGPLTVEFLQGDLLVGDKVVVYNGPNALSAVLFNGNNGGDMTGVTVNSFNSSSLISIQVLSDGAGSCQGGQAQTPLQWFVSCGAVNVDEEPTEIDFVLFPNPSQGTLNIGLNHHWTGVVTVNVVDLSGRTVLSEQLTVSGNGNVTTLDLNGLSNGQYAVQMTTDRWTRTKQIQVMR